MWSPRLALLCSASFLCTAVLSCSSSPATSSVAWDSSSDSIEYVKLRSDGVLELMMTGGGEVFFSKVVLTGGFGMVADVGCRELPPLSAGFGSPQGRLHNFYSGFSNSGVAHEIDLVPTFERTETLRRPEYSEEERLLLLDGWFLPESFVEGEGRSEIHISVPITASWLRKADRVQRCEGIYRKDVTLTRAD